MPTTEAKLSRLRKWVIILAGIVVFAAVAAPYAVITSTAHESAETQLVVSCEGIDNQVTMLEALRSFSDQIGVPWVYPIPEVPPECNGH
jgi:flagellar basal body-associated protein FliL